MRHPIFRTHDVRLIQACLVAVALGIACAFFASGLKTIAEGAEHYVLSSILAHASWLLLFTPLVGLLLIGWVLDKVFKTKLGGIREVLNSLQEPILPLKLIKGAIHFFTGTATIASGGSTGIEVSTVIGSAAVGSWMGHQRPFDDGLRRHLIIAGAAAGIAGLFKSPLGGIFFAIEVLMTGFSWELIGLTAIASFTAFGVRNLFDSSPMFSTMLHGWRIHAIPFFVLFSGLAAVLSVYLTRAVISAKTFLTTRLSPIMGVCLGACLLGLLVWSVNQLYGEGYSFVQGLLDHHTQAGMMNSFSPIFLLPLLLILKPLATSLTLGSGGDGGVFAPSMFLGAVAGALFAQVVNYLGGSVIEVNFIIIGMAAILGSSLHAPLTAAFLVMSVTGSYELFVPIMLTSVLSSYCAKKIYPFTVYSYR